MAYNNFANYGNYGYTPYPQYNPNMGYHNFQNQQMNQQINQNQMMQSQPQQQVTPTPFSEAMFGTLKEAEGYLVTPNKSACFVNNAMGEIYIKSADAMGNLSLKTYKQCDIDNKPQESKTVEIDPKNFAKIDDLKDFAKIKDLELLADKESLSEINFKLGAFEKQLKEISKVLGLIKGEDNGKQR